MLAGDVTYEKKGRGKSEVGKRGEKRGTNNGVKKGGEVAVQPGISKGGGGGETAVCQSTRSITGGGRNRRKSHLGIRKTPPAMKGRERGQRGRTKNVEETTRNLLTCWCWLKTTK